MKSTLLLLFVIGTLTPALAQTVRYVSATGTNTNPATATTWATATANLQGAINASAAGEQVWVRAGTYKPGSPANTDRSISFAMKAGVAIYGGFAGNETLLSQRPGVNPVSGAGRAAQPSSSTLSGNIGAPGTVADNSYHVVRNPAGLTGTARLDGFVITGGNAGGGPETDGGGIYNVGSSPTLANCSLQNNRANDTGGGIAITGSSSPTLIACLLQDNVASNGGAVFSSNSIGTPTGPTLTDCSLQGNAATDYGGAIFSFGGRPTLTNCRLQDNRASNGGAIYNSSSNPVLTDCVLQGNAASGSGGGIYNENSNPALTNCHLQTNPAVVNGGGIYNNNSNPTLTTCVLQGNSAGNDGGGIYNTGSSSPTLLNCVLQSNSATRYGGAIHNTGSSNPVLVNCGLQGNSAGAGGAILNDSSNPVLVNCSLQGNSGTGGAIYNSTSFCTLTNCILFGNGGSNAITLPSGTVAASYCLFENTVTGYVGMGNNLRTRVSPFVSGSNTQLAAGSPAINAGNPASVTVASGPYSALSLPATDLTGNPRISGCAVDMGAVEYPFPAAGPPTRLYVNATATGTKTGLSWADAFTTLQPALTYPCSQALTEVWVAAGVYTPTGTSDRTDSDRYLSFAMRAGVAIYGGFTGNETLLSQRPGVNPVAGAGGVAQPSSSTLSGNIGEPGSSADNSFHVIRNPAGLTGTARLDGFVITGGSASGEDIDGGGIYNDGSIGTPTGPTLANCSLQNNAATRYGGGLFNRSSSPTLLNCVLQSNSATRYGGAIHNTGSSNPVLVNCGLQGNSAGAGGAILNDSSNPVLVNCSLQGNSGTGGAIYNSTSFCTLTNCILFGNSGSNAIALLSGQVSASYCLFENTVTGYVGMGNNLRTSVSPFVSGSGTQLAIGSPAVNAGSNAAYTAANGPATDLAGNARIVGSAIDMGAYEFQGSLPVTLRYFSGRMTDAGAVLGWGTARETDNAHFQIERSADRNRTGGPAGPGLAFESIATIPTRAVDGNSITELIYSYLDTQPLPGINYYRLVQTDRDGSRTTHHIIALSRDNAPSVLFPNPVPASGEASIEPGIAHTGYQISDVLGRVVQRTDAPGLLDRVSLAGLPAGVYLLHVQTIDGGVRTWRLLR